MNTSSFECKNGFVKEYFLFLFQEIINRISIYRSQDKDFIEMALSEDYRRRRHRRYTISIQMTVISWILEMVTGIIAMVTTLFFSHHEIFNTTTQTLMFIYIFLYFVAIPGSYLLSTEVLKNLIVKRGWRIVTPFPKCHNRVFPISNEGNDHVSQAANEAIASNNIQEYNHPAESNHVSAPTISGNVNCETSYVVY